MARSVSDDAIVVLEGPDCFPVAPLGPWLTRSDNGRGEQVWQMREQYCVYIMTNKHNTVLYTGVTGNLKRRVYEHREKSVAGFTRKYNIAKLVYYEVCDEAYSAITREKQIKAGSRQKKVALVESMNKEWRDLYEEL
jgi:putative endonuclease